MYRKNQNKFLMATFIVALVGISLYFVDKGPSKLIGMVLLTLSFIFYGGDSILKYRMTRGTQFIVMAVFFYILAAVGAYTITTIFMGQ